MLAAAAAVLVVGFLADAVTLSVALVASRPLTDRVMLDYLPLTTLLPGGVALSLVTAALERIAKSIDAPRLVRRARRVQGLAIVAVVTALGPIAGWGRLPANVAAAILHFLLAGQARAALVEVVMHRAVTPAAAVPEEPGKKRPSPALPVAAALTGLATLVFVASTIVVRRSEPRTNVMLLLAVDTEASVVAARCGDPRAKLPVVPLEAAHQTEDPTSDPILNLTADGDVFHRSHLVARISGACVQDVAGGVLASVDARGLVSGPRREPWGAFKRRETLKESGMVPSVGEALVSPDGAITGITDEGAVYYVGPRRERGGGGDEASSLPAAVTGQVSRARRTALLLYSLIGRLDPADR
jgi:hypothetical protein